MLTSLHLYIITQIVGEALPISSSSHITLLSKYITLPVLPSHFDELLHAPTLLVLIIFFWQDLMLLPKMLGTRSYTGAQLTSIVWHTTLFASITTVIAAGGYGVIKVLGKQLVEQNHSGFMLTGLCATALLLASLAWCTHRPQPKKPCLTLQDAVILGSAQAIALLPGISRFAATFVTARWLGYSYKRAFQLSFLLQLPLIVAALGLQALPALVRSGQLATLLTTGNLMVTAGASVVAYLALLLCWHLAAHNYLYTFSWYMLAPIATTVWLFFIH